MPQLPRIMLLAAIAAVSTGVPLASAQTSQQADEHLSRGLSRYDARDYEGALIEFHAGYKLEPRPEFLFALAQAERLSGDCASAMVYYQEFIDSGPTPRQERAARMQLERCQIALASGPAAGAPVRTEHDDARAEEAASGLSAQTTAQAAQAALAVASSRPEHAQHDTWYCNMAGHTLLGTGAVTLLAGAGLLWSSSSAQEQSSMATSYPAYDATIGKAQRQRAWGLVALGTGSALLAGAVYRYITHEEQHELLITPHSRGIAFGYGGRF